MEKIQIEVSKASLKQMDEAGIKYTVTNADISIEKVLTTHTDVSELSNYELGKIVIIAKEAISKGAKYGIAIDTKSGRDMNDHRCYSLNEAFVVDANHHECRHTVTELLTG